MATKQDVAQVLGCFRMARLKPEMSEDDYEQMAEVWTKFLADIPAEALRLAAEECCIADDPWLPSVGQLRHKALDLLADDAQLMTAGEAWDEVCREIHRVGHDGKPEFSQENVRRAVSGVGGWFYLCTSQNPMADRARFFQTFDAYQKRSKADARMLPAVREFASKRRRLTCPQPIRDLLMYPRMALPPPAQEPHD